MSNTITTKHPSGRPGPSMDADSYEKIKEVVLRILGEQEGISVSELARLSYNELNDQIEGDVVAMTKAVKNDLESRGVLARHYRPGKHKVSLINND